MSTKNYEKGFDFRRFLVEELRDSELGRRRDKLLNFIGKTRKEPNLEINLGFLDDGKGVEKVWVGFRVALVYLQIFWEFFWNKKA